MRQILHGSQLRRSFIAIVRLVATAIFSAGLEQASYLSQAIQFGDNDVTTPGQPCQSIKLSSQANGPARGAFRLEGGLTARWSSAREKKGPAGPFLAYQRRQ